MRDDAFALQLRNELRRTGIAAMHVRRVALVRTSVSPRLLQFDRAESIFVMRPLIDALDFSVRRRTCEAIDRGMFSTREGRSRHHGELG
jgi:hypothetical protein